MSRRRWIAAALAAVMLFGAAPVRALAEEAEEPALTETAAEITEAAPVGEPEEEPAPEAEAPEAAEAEEEPVFTEAASVDESGQCGDSVSWRLRGQEGDLTLTISGSGSMSNYSNSDDTPWSAWISQITSIKVEEGVTVLGDCAFCGCTNLTTVSLPSTLVSIGVAMKETWGVFGDCTSLTSIVIPEGVTTIGGRAFGNTWSGGLETITLPSTLTTIGENAFTNTNLSTVVLPDGVTTIAPHAFDGVPMTHITIPGSVRLIDNGVFAHSKLTHVTMLEGVKQVLSAFNNAYYVQSAYVPASMTFISDYAFPPSMKVIFYGGTEAQWQRLGYSGYGSSDFTVIYEMTDPVYRMFTDVTDTEGFYFRPVYWAAAKNITTGWADGTFRPWNTCNRASVVTFLWRLAGCPAPAHMATFRDMPADTPGNSDFRNAISWAVEQNITNGWSDNTFRPWNTCNRASIVTFLWRYAGRPSAAAATFRDMTGNSDFDQAISWAAENGITTGYAGNVFKPWNNCNRLAVMSFLYRYAHLG